MKKSFKKYKNLNFVPLQKVVKIKKQQYTELIYRSFKSCYDVPQTNKWHAYWLVLFAPLVILLVTLTHVIALVKARDHVTRLLCKYKPVEISLCSAVCASLQANRVNQKGHVTHADDK